ncbi:MAG: DUF2167 domain-containing protein [Opitutus sp.]
MRLLRLLVLALFVPCLGISQERPARTASSDAPPKTREEALERAGIKLVAGPKTVPLGKAAELKLPAGHGFVGPDSLDLFYQLTQNVRSGNEVGVVVAPGFMLFFDYDEVGYVKDGDKDKLDAAKLMKTMSEGQNAANEDRKSRGWDELKLQGWATPPHYDERTNNLRWAINLSTSADGHREIFINESIRLLGRSGVMNVTLASDSAGFKTAETQVEKLLADNFNYVSGQKYAEFKAGDKIAAYGLSALVLGGAGVMAAKAGLFANLGVLLGKFWKGIVAVVLALAAGFRKLFNNLTGPRPGDRP